MAKPTDHAARVETLRGKIAALQEQRRTIEQAPLPRAETLALIRANIQRAAAEWLRSHNVGPVTAAPPAAIGHLDLGVPLAIIAPDQLEDALLAARDHQLAGIEDGLPARDRPQALADIDARILEAEIEEEREIVAAERLSMPILRRPDADPRAVLIVA